jgi:glucose-6-phosphate isomerase
MRDILIVGFGASSLNLRALLSSSYNHRVNIHFLDSQDIHYVDEIIKKVDLSECITYVISKSGSTSETNILAKLVIEMGARNLKIICSDKNSELGHIVLNIRHEWIDFIGENSGRFALLTKPFMDIAKEAGIDVKALEKGAALIDMKDIEKKAELWLQHFKEGRIVWVIMLYSKQMHGLFMWIRQIVSESLGKEGFGILPFLCEGSMDEHSQLQLFLDGPKDKFYELISCGYDGELALLSEMQTQHAEKVTSLLKAKNLPCEHIHHELVDAFLIGKYIATYLSLVKIIGRKLGFDPLTQPAVESMKKRAHEA